jgi:prevent-host-death family protein
MKVASITEAKNGLSALIDYVRSGETVLIVDRGVPVARLESAVSAGVDAPGRLARLARAGLVRVKEENFPARLLDERPPRPRRNVSAVDALLRERRQGR